MKNKIHSLIVAVLTTLLMAACSNREPAKEIEKKDSVAVEAFIDSVPVAAVTEKLNPPPPPPPPKLLPFTPPQIVVEEPNNEEDFQNSHDDVEQNVISDAPFDLPNVNEDITYTVVEQIATYPGGTDAMMRYINGHLTYPTLAKEQGLEGTVQARFVVNKDGKISQLTVTKSSGSNLLDEEAIRVLKSMPKWTPAVINGKNVNSYFTVPVTFRLD